MAGTPDRGPKDDNMTTGRAPKQQSSRKGLEKATTTDEGLEKAPKIRERMTTNQKTCATWDGVRSSAEKNRKHRKHCESHNFPCETSAVKPPRVKYYTTMVVIENITLCIGICNTCGDVISAIHCRAINCLSGKFF